MAIDDRDYGTAPPAFSASRGQRAVAQRPWLQLNGKERDFRQEPFMLQATGWKAIITDSDAPAVSGTADAVFRSARQKTIQLRAWQRLVKTIVMSPAEARPVGVYRNANEYALYSISPGFPTGVLESDKGWTVSFVDLTYEPSAREWTLIVEVECQTIPLPLYKNSLDIWQETIDIPVTRPPASL